MSDLALKRLTKEYRRLKDKPLDNVLAAPFEGNLLKWYFVLHSLDHRDYEGGVYIGVIHFASEYPMKPPDIVFHTPNGRFETNKKICLSFTSYHPESWNPAWSFENMMIGLVSFMLSEENATGVVSCSSSQRRAYAAKSMEFNMKDKDFNKMFLGDVQEIEMKNQGMRKERNSKVEEKEGMQETSGRARKSVGGARKSVGGGNAEIVVRWVVAAIVGIVLLIFVFSG